MIARCISYTGDRATIVLTPCWFARLLGARTVSVDLERRATGWHAIATGRDLDHLPDGSAIRDALDFREVGSPSRMALAGVESIAP